MLVSETTSSIIDLADVPFPNLAFGGRFLLLLFCFEKLFTVCRYEPFLTFIALTEHIHQLHNGSSADGGDILDSGVKKDKNGTEGGDRSVDDIDSGVFVPSKTSTGSTHGAPVAGMVCAATDMAIDSSNYVEYQTAPSMQWAASQCVHPFGIFHLNLTGVGLPLW